MERVEFDFKRFNYLFFLELQGRQLNVGIIEVNKNEVKDISDREKELYLKNIGNVDYDILYKMETNINSRSLVDIIKFINKSVYLFCETKHTKNFLFQNFNKSNFEIELKFKIRI